ncbi:hypothetical protein AN958_10314 [Leucoagaricus sp. SymC.cos]|nr:hypothetical protein AN958_10314 [Leucoagaricus sp. SymC.cos]
MACKIALPRSRTSKQDFQRQLNREQINLKQVIQVTHISPSSGLVMIWATCFLVVFSLYISL